MKEEIENAMMDNFKHEQNTIEQLFKRYQQYKPLVSGLYGQDVVKADEEMPVNYQEMKTQ